MNVSFHVDVSGLRRNLKEFVRVSKKDAIKVYRSEMGLLVERCIELTAPPHGRGGASAAKKQGEGAISSDLGRIFVGADVGVVKSFADKFGGRFIQGQFIGKNGVYGQEEIVFNPTGSNMQQHHAAFRTKNGRVTRAGTFTRNIGRWKFVNKMYVPNAALKRYIRMVQQHVGRAKAGWMSGAIMFGSKKVPAWVRRHGSGDGSASQNISFTKTVLEAVNRNKAIGFLDGKASIVANAVKGRSRDIASKIQQILDRQAAKFSRSR